ncbi:MAG: hypothetical protein AAF497_07715 [Planctomycetota bacterium]
MQLITKRVPCVLILFILAACGCKQDPSQWTPDDRAKILDVIANVSETRADPERFAKLFADDAVPDKKWVKTSKGQSIVVEDMSFEDDVATVKIVFENHFGELQGNATWTCKRSGETWVITSSPLE